MSGGVHSGYVNILEDMLTERRFERDLELAESLRRRPVAQPESRPFPIWVLILGTFIGVLVSCASYYFIVREQKPVVVAEVPVVHDRLAQEMTLMKQILTGLVGAVQTLENERPTPAQAVKTTAIEARNDALRVVTERANLRDRPDRMARSLAVVPRNTFLLSDDFKDGWYRVTTPLGEAAWVSEEVVTLEGAP